MSEAVLAQFRGGELYPSLNAPVFSQHGGRIDEGFELTMTTSSGEMYYTVETRRCDSAPSDIESF